LKLFYKIKQKFIDFLKQGISPEKLALAVALGICLGIIPLLGATSLLCMAAAFSFRLNMGAIQVVNYLTYPLQLILYIPFLKYGASIFSNEKFNYSLSEITTMLSENTWQTIQKFFWVNVYGLLLWLIIAAVLYIFLYFICLRSFRILSTTIKQNQTGSK
jgi:uncharacterized protein (DUF2062 family)